MKDRSLDFHLFGIVNLCLLGALLDLLLLLPLNLLLSLLFRFWVIELWLVKCIVYSEQFLADGGFFTEDLVEILPLLLQFWVV